MDTSKARNQMNKSKFQTIKFHLLNSIEKISILILGKRLFQSMEKIAVRGRFVSGLRPGQDGRNSHTFGSEINIIKI